MPFTKRTIYTCTKCGRQYSEQPRECDCENKVEVGSVIGPFKLLERVDSDHWKVTCLLCDLIKTIHRTNIKRSSSCGCKPRHIQISSFTPNSIRYRCEKCNTSTVTKFPVLEWCCNVDNL